jgi:translocation and assembly module TamB
MKRTWIWGAVAVAAVAGLLALAYAGRGVLIAPYLSALIRETIRAQLGLDVSIGRVSGSLVADLEIDDVQTVGPPADGPVRSLSWKRLRLRYSLRSLLEGLPSFGGGAGLDLEGLRLQVDLSREPASSAPGPTFASFSPRLPTLSIRDAEVGIRAADFNLILDGLRLDAGKASPEGQPLHLYVAEGRWSHPRIRSGTGSISAELNLSAHAVRMDRLRINGEPLVEGLRLELPPASDRLPFAARLRIGGGHLDVQGELTDSSVQANLTAREIQIASAADWFKLDSRGLLSLDAAVSLPFETPADMSGRLDLAIGGAAFWGRHDLDLRLKAGLSHGRLGVETLDVSLLRSRGVVSDATVSWSEVLKGNTEGLLRQLSGDFRLTSEDVPALLSLAGVNRLPAGTRIPDHRLTLAGRMQNGTLVVPGGELVSGAGSVRIQDLQTTLPLMGAQTPLRVDLRLQLPDLRAVASLFGLPPLGGSLTGNLSASGRLDRLTGRAELTAAGLAIQGRPLGEVSLRAMAERETIRVESLSVRNGRDRLDARGSFDVSARRFGPTRIDLQTEAAEDYLPLLVSDGSWPSGKVIGRLEGSGSLREPEFSLDFFLERLPAGAWTLMDTRIQAQGAEHRVRIHSAQSSTPLGQIRLAGDLDRFPAEGRFELGLQDLTIAGKGLALTLEAPARIRYATPETVSVSGLRLGGPQGRVSVQGTLAVRGRSDLSLQFSELNGAEWLPKLTGIPLSVEGLNAALQIRGSVAAGGISAQGSVRHLGAAGTVLSYAGRFDLSYSGRRLQIAALDLSGPEGHRLSLSGSLPFDPTGDPVLIPGALDVALTGRAPDFKLVRSLFPGWPFAAGSLEADLGLYGSWQAPRGTLRLNGRGLTLARVSGLIPPGPYEGRVNASLDGRRLILQEVELEGPHAKLHGQGVWRDLPAFSEPIPGGAAAWGAVSLEGRLVADDLGWMARHFKDIRRVAGRLEVAMKAEGPLSDPDVQADIRLSRGELRPEVDLPPLQALHLNAHLAGRVLSVQSLDGELGGAPFQMSGSIRNLFAAEDQAQVDLRLKGEDLLLLRRQTLRMRADADLRLSGPWERLRLSGTLAFTEGLFGKNLGLAEGLTAGSAKPKAGAGIELFTFADPPLRDMAFDVEIRSRTPFKVKNNLVKGAVRPELHLTGTGEVPALIGRIYLDPCTLFLPAGRMQFDSGIIRFDAADPGRPRLDMSGRAQMIGYDISAVVEGPYDEPAVFLSSAPPLPDQDLLALVLTGQPPKTPGGESVERRQGLNVAVFIGRDVLMRMPGGGATESLQTVLERFDVDVGRAVTRGGDETINARFRLAEGLLQNGDTLYITGEKDVFDQYNAGVRIVFRFR